MEDIRQSMMEYEEDTLTGKFLIFSLGNENYGIEIRYVIEIIGIQPITEIPELPEYMKGIINLRGKIIPVIDVRTRFKKEWRDYDDRTCIIVVEMKNVFVGLIIDRVSEVLSIPAENMAEPPNLSKGDHNRYIKGIGKVGTGVKLILDCERLLNDNEVESLSEIHL